MTEHITITLQHLGLKTRAQTLLLLDPNGNHYTCDADSGAKALTNLVEKLIKNHAGAEFHVEGDPRLDGIVPKRHFRKPPIRRKNRPKTERLF